MLRSLILLCLLVLSRYTYAQQTRSQKLDSLYNDPFFYSTVSAIILPKGFVEVNNFASILSTNQLFNAQAERQNLNARLSQFVNVVQVSYGTSATSRFNIGADVQYSAVRLDTDPNASPFGVFSSDSTYFRESAFTNAGLRFRWKPLAHNRQFLIQGSVYQPIYKPTMTQMSLRVQVIYVIELSRRLFLYTQPGITYNLPKKAIRGNVSVPLTALFQYQVRTRLGLLGLLNHTIGLNKNAEGVFRQGSWGSQIGLGVQVQPSLRFGFTAFVTQYVAGKSTGVFQTANLGVRVIL